MNASFSVYSESTRSFDRIHRLLLVMLVFLCFHLPSTSATPITYTVEVDTSAILGGDGYLDFQFNGNGLSSQDAVATISGFVTNAALDATSQADGSASGVLPSSLIIANTTFFNAILQGITYGSFLDFELAISGDAVDNPLSGSETSLFSLSLLDTSFAPLLTTDLSGSVLTIVVLDNGTTSIATFDADNLGTPSVVTATGHSTSVPLPSVPALLALAIVLISFPRRQRRAAVGTNDTP